MAQRPALVRTRTKIAKANEWLEKDEDDPLLLGCQGHDKALDLIFEFKEKLKTLDETSQVVLRSLAALGEAQKAAVNSMKLLSPIFKGDTCIRDAMQAVSGFNDVMLEGQTMLAGGLKDLMALLLECLPEGLLQDTKNNKKKFDRVLIEYVNAKEAYQIANSKEKKDKKINLAELDKSWDGAHEELEMGYRDIRKSLDISSMIMRRMATETLCNYLSSYYTYFETGFSHLNQLMKSEQCASWKRHSILLHRQIQYQKDRPCPPPVRLFGVSVRDILEREQNPPSTPDIISCPAPIPTLLVSGMGGKCPVRSRSFEHTSPRCTSPVNFGSPSPKVALSPPLSPSSRPLPMIPSPELQTPPPTRPKRTIVYPPPGTQVSFSASNIEDKKFPISPPPGAMSASRHLSPSLSSESSSESLALEEQGSGRRSGPLPKSASLMDGEVMTPTLSRRMDVKNRLPRFIRKLVDYIMRYALDMEGIFRISIAQEPLEKLVREINRGDNIDISAACGDNPHVACVLLKKVIREFPEPLCTFALYQRFVAILECSPDERINRLRALFRELDDINRDCIQAICELCGMIIERSEINKMTASNLGVVMGPCLLSASRDLDSTTGFSTESNEVFTFVFENHEKIFMEFPPLFIQHGDQPSTPTQSRPSFQVRETVKLPQGIIREAIPLEKNIITPPPVSPQNRERPAPQSQKPPKPQTPPKTRKEPPKDPADLVLMSGALLKLNDGTHDRDEREKRRIRQRNSLAFSNRMCKEKSEEDLQV